MNEESPILASNFRMRVCSLLLLAMLFSSCAGTIKTTNYAKEPNRNFKKACIISTEGSKYIKFRFGVLTPFGIYVPADKAAIEHSTIGNTAEVIKQELENNGITATIAAADTVLTDFDLIIEYNDVWRWDFKKILDHLDLFFISGTGDQLLAKSSFSIYKNKELHNFPTPEKEVPKMIKEFLNPK
ncbi:hypothetical protein FFWV33_13945 [Flavobacterium faecale]|uniref:DUF4823 domain-containing protein n=1 Tax=Flavobacterium faecale TaxID=1355330 RepID=A0A2S1LFJ0_9FLAO|nr:hypothetical protein [Flavobacterium faecale]AWG22550.1 hypothetical protein FFWV33_13945 [Flavobacterium faecale]